MKRAPRGTGPFVSILINMLKIAVPLMIIAVGAVWVLSHKSVSTGQVRVTTSIPGADIYIAGVQTGYMSDTILEGVPVGRQLITVRKPGYVSEPEVAIVEVYEDRIANASFLFKEAKDVAKKDSITPIRAVRQEIFSTGEPVISIPPAPQSRRIVKYEDDYVPEDYEYYPDTSSPVERQSHLTQSAPPTSPEASTQTARKALSETEITVTSNPEGASIIVNSALTPHTTPYTFNGLDRGLYAFSLSKEGYNVYPAEISVSLSRSGQSELVAFNLKPDDTWPRPLVRLLTEPLAAGILIDGVPVGVGQTDIQMEFGRHTVTFADVAGYQSPEPLEVNITPDDIEIPDIVGTYERISGNAFLAVVPASSVKPFDGSLLRIYVDNELILDGHDEPFDLTLVGSLLPGKRLIRIEYGELANDIHVDLSDGDVAEVNFRIESFFSKRKLKLKELREVTLEKWQSKYRNLNILSLS
ncbi:PEGA domain-containing protein [bacterium]|nr:PEGA domain-containing protein [bacterium]MBU1919945.1 PEGA domain-containing protein [bacterium]